MSAGTSTCDRNRTLLPRSEVVDFFVLGFDAEGFVAGLSTVAVVLTSFFVDSFLCFFLGGSSAPTTFEAAGDSADLADASAVIATPSARCSVGLSEGVVTTSKDTLRFRAKGVFAGVIEASVTGATSGCAAGWPGVTTPTDSPEGDTDEVVVIVFPGDGCSCGCYNDCRFRTSRDLECVDSQVQPGVEWNPETCPQ